MKFGTPYKIRFCSDLCNFYACLLTNKKLFKDADFLNKPALQDNMALDSLLFQSNVFSNECAKLCRHDQDDPSCLNQPKRHAMLEKLLAE